MTDRDRMIHGMCVTMRHDFGLLDEETRAFWIRQMDQIAYHNVDPVVIKAYRAGQRDMRKRAAEKAALLMPHLGQATAIIETIEDLPIEDPK